MGACACSCEKYRPRYKHHVRDAVLTGKNKDLQNYAQQSQRKLPSIGRYLFKQVRNRITKEDDVQNAMNAFDALIESCHSDLNYFDTFVIEALRTLFHYGLDHKQPNYLEYACNTLKILLPYTKLFQSKKKNVSLSFFFFNNVSFLRNKKKLNNFVFSGHLKIKYTQLFFSNCAKDDTNTFLLFVLYLK